MKRGTFLGKGIPPRAQKCDAGECNRIIAINAECWRNENGYRDEAFCSPDCYGDRYPHDPALNEWRKVVQSKADARPADDDNETW